MLYIPNLSNTTLKSSLINPEETKSYYKDGEIMNVLVGGSSSKGLNFVVSSEWKWIICVISFDFEIRAKL